MLDGGKLKAENFGELPEGRGEHPFGLRDDNIQEGFDCSESVEVRAHPLGEGTSPLRC
jgi:hypothetical protein